MKPRAFDHIAPQTIDEALKALQDGGEDAKLLAGGQTLVPVMNFRLAAPILLVDLNRIPELSGITLEADGSVRIGAMTRHRAVELSDVVREYMPLLNAAMPHIAHVQIRNRGTIGGSLAHSDPAAEWPALCLALDAQMTIVGPSGRRVVPASEFAVGILTTALEPDEILTEITFPAMSTQRRFGFQEIARRRGDFALAGVACTIELDQSGRVSSSRIVGFGIDDTPVLLEPVSELISGQHLTDLVLHEAGRTAAESVAPRSDFHASDEYRRELTDVLVRRALLQASADQAERKEAA